MTLETLATPTHGAASEDRRERGLPLPIIDSDVHPTVAAISEMRPCLSERWWRYFRTYGARPKHGFAQGDPFPKAAPRAARRDAWTPNAKPPGSDLELMRRQYLDALNVEYGILAPCSLPARAIAIRSSPRPSAPRSTTGSATDGRGRSGASRPRS